MHTRIQFRDWGEALTLEEEVNEAAEDEPEGGDGLAGPQAGTAALDDDEGGAEDDGAAGGEARDQLGPGELVGHVVGHERPEREVRVFRHRRIHDVKRGGGQRCDVM